MYLELLNEVSNNHNLIFRAITRDKIWGYCYNPETHQQSCHWNRLSSPKSEESEAGHIEHQEHTGDPFSECGDNVWQGLFPSGYMVNQHHYQEILQHTRKTINPKYLE